MVAARAAACGLDVGGELAGRLAAYLDLVLRWNRRMNLTSVTAEGPGIDRLLLEPMAAAGWLPAGRRIRLVDVGSGCGSPGIPLKLLRPDLRLTMVESRQRRAAFLRETVRVLELDETQVAACRVEDLRGWERWSEPADVASVRGVKLGAAQMEQVRALVRPSGALLCFGGDVVPAGDGWRLERRERLPVGSGWLSLLCSTKIR